MTHSLKAWTVALSLSLAGIGAAAAEEPAYVPRAPLANEWGQSLKIEF